MTTPLTVNGTRRKNNGFDLAVTRLIRATLASKGMSESQISSMLSKHEVAAMVFATAQMASYASKGILREDAYDRTFADLSAWAMGLS